MLDLYKNIKKFRIEKDMSQDELARRVGYVGKSMVAKIENGHVDLAYSKIIAFADALGVKPSVLMGWIEEEKAPLDKRTKKHLDTYLSLSPERRAKVSAYAEDQLEIQEIQKKKEAKMA